MATDVPRSKESVKVAVGQMTACSDIDANFQTCARLVQVCL